MLAGEVTTVRWSSVCQIRQICITSIGVSSDYYCTDEDDHFIMLL